MEKICIDIIKNKIPQFYNKNISVHTVNNLKKEIMQFMQDEKEIRNYGNEDYTNVKGITLPQYKKREHSHIFINSQLNDYSYIITFIHEYLHAIHFENNIDKNIFISDWPYIRAIMMYSEYYAVYHSYLLGLMYYGTKNDNYNYNKIWCDLIAVYKSTCVKPIAYKNRNLYFTTHYLATYKVIKDLYDLDEQKRHRSIKFDIMTDILTNNELSNYLMHLEKSKISMRDFQSYIDNLQFLSNE